MQIKYRHSARTDMKHGIYYYHAQIFTDSLFLSHTPIIIEISITNETNYPFKNTKYV